MGTRASRLLSLIKEHGEDVVNAVRRALPEGDVADWAAAIRSSKLAERAENARRFVANSIVREGKEPKRVYSGTSKDADFTSFRVPRNGAWFTDNPKIASDYALANDSMNLVRDPSGPNPWSMKHTNTASRVMPAYLNIENPMVYPNQQALSDATYALGGENYQKGQRALFDQLRAQGFDGVDAGDGTFIVLGGPHQIKSASGNIGSFDPKQKRMDKARGGLAVKRRRRAR